MASEKKLSRSRELGIKVIYAALSILHDNGNEMPMRDLAALVEKKVDLDEWAKERYEKSGYIRWESMMHFYSITCVKAGYLLKKKGLWYLTPEGEEALKLSPVDFLNSAIKLYKEWKAEQPTDDTDDSGDDGATKEDDFNYYKI